MRSSCALWHRRGRVDLKMSEPTYNVVVPEKGVLIKAWTKGVPLEDQAALIANVPPFEHWRAVAARRIPALER
jgi:hypothetical protein